MDAAFIDNIRRRLDAGNIEHPAAAHVFARNLVRHKHHVALGLLELGAVALIRVSGQTVNLLPYQPLEFVRL